MNSIKNHLRPALMLLLAAFMFTGPFYRQVLRGHNDYFPRWVMYRGAGLGLVRVEFIVEDYKGKMRRLDRFKTLGYELHTVTGKPGLDEVISDIISKHRGDRALIVNATIATEWGWKPLYCEKRFELNQKSR